VVFNLARKDLQDWINDLERSDLLVRVREEIDPAHIAGVVDANYKKATFIENIRGYDVPLLANSLSNRRMVSVALGTTEDKLLETFRERMKNRIRPVVVKSDSLQPCQEMVSIGDEVDLTEFPIPLQHEFDGGPYITAGVLVANHPISNKTNLGIYRLMLRTRNELGIGLTPPHKLRRYYQIAMERKSRPLEVACAIGFHGLDILSSEVSGPDDIDEYDTMGGFKGEPVELVKCKTIDVYVPTNAEIVLECEMPLTGWAYDEGPYGEFSGTYGGLKSNPILTVKAITRKKHPIFLSATHGGAHPGWTDFNMLIPIFEQAILDSLRAANIDVKAIRFHPGSSGMWLIASIKTWSEGDGRNALMLMLTASNQNFPKYAVVVDDDIDIFDDEAVNWAMTWRAQPAEDVMIFEGLKCIPLDPSLPTETPPITTSKMGFDATRPLSKPAFRFVRCLPPYMNEISFGGKIGTLPRAMEQDNSPSSDKGMRGGHKITSDSPIHEGMRSRPSSNHIKELSGRIVKLLKDRPCYFKDILDALRNDGYRAALLAWSEMRTQNQLVRDEAGRYLIK
jgi:4-hydroxy-3-polyprenylbenzoate decarboxylase